MRPGRFPAPSAAALAAALVLLAASSPAGAAVCSRGNAPAATLLVPYFEVDVANPGGKTTLFSIGSIAATEIATQVTLWTDWGIPLWSFYVVVPPDGVVTLNMRDVLRYRVPPPSVSSDPEALPDCASIGLRLPPAITPEQLQRRLAGLPDAANLCFASDRGETDLAVGFLTVDVVGDCAFEEHYPLDPGYSELVRSDNLLWGDVFYVDPDDDSAQGSPATAFPAVAETRPPTPYLYLDRIAPDEIWRTRFLSGGGLDTSTELVVWLADFRNAFPGAAPRNGLPCGAYRYANVVAVRWGPEAGPLQPTSVPRDPPLFELAAVTSKLTVGELLGDDLPIGGSIEIDGRNRLAPGMVGDDRIQLVVAATHRAAGRFSVGVEATPVGGPCEEPTF